MESSKLNGQFAAPGSFQVDGTAWSVVSIGPHPLGHRQMRQIQDRRDRARNGTRIGAPLADVVQKCCFDHLGVAWERRFDSPRDDDGMALIGDALSPEELCAPGREVVVHVSLFVWAQRPGAVVPEEPNDQVPSFPKGRRHDVALHPTQRRAAGKYSMRSGSISSPQVSQMP